MKLRVLKKRAVRRLKGIVEIQCNDYTEYDSERCHDGGAYAYYTTYKRLPNNKWEITYDASCGCCPVCGRIGSCDCYEWSTPEVISSLEMVERLDNYWPYQKRYHWDPNDIYYEFKRADGTSQFMPEQ